MFRLVLTCLILKVSRVMVNFNAIDDANLDPDLNYFYSNATNNAESNCKFYTVHEFNGEFFGGDSGLTIVGCNVRSFQANIDKLLSIFYNETPDVLVISESWFNLDSCQNLDGYNAYHTVNTRPTGRGGGVSMFIKPELMPKPVSELSYSNSAIEVNTNQISSNGLNAFIVGIYRPHEGDVYNFTEALLEILNNPILANKFVVIVGDMNVNILLTETRTDHFVNSLRSLHFVPMIDKPTRFPTIPGHSPSLLDHFWVNKIDNYLSGVVSIDVSDHCPIFMKVPFIRHENNNSRIKVSFRIQNDQNIEKLAYRLLNYDWSAIHSPDCDLYVDRFLSALDEMYCDSFQKVTKYITVKRLNKPWFSSEIQNIVNLKSDTFKLCRLGLVSQEENTNVKNRLNSKIRSEKRRYFNRVFSQCMNNMKETWKNIKYLMSKTNNYKTIKSIIINDVEDFDEVSIARIFNDYFSKVASNISHNAPTNNIDPLSYVNRIRSSLFLSPVTINEVFNIIKSLKCTKSGLNSFPVRMFKLFADILAPIVADIVNLCFISGKFPNCLKCSFVTPVHKKGDVKLTSNYRPISNIPYLSKVIEKCLLVRMNSFLNKNNILTSNQFGFRKNSSTQLAMIKFVDFIYDSLDNNNHAIAIFVDYQKAFDVVNHDILFRKLEAYGIRANALNLIISYLKDRRQYVRINQSLSNEQIMNTGVPQGSNIGPLFFLLYINDMIKIFTKTSVILFADDTTLLFTNNSFNSLIQDCNSELMKFREWNIANRLSLNVTKTNVMLFSNRIREPVNIMISYGDQNLEIVKSTVFLGLRLDDTLKFDTHITHLCNKIARCLGIMYKIKDLVPSRILTQIYYSLIYPYIIYCNPIWSNTYKIHIKPLELLQKKAVRIVTGSEYLAHTNPLYFRTKILKLPDVSLYCINLHVFKNFDEYNVQGDHGYNTRGVLNLRPVYRRLTSIYSAVTKFYRTKKLERITE